MTTLSKPGRRSLLAISVLASQFFLSAMVFAQSGEDFEGAASVPATETTTDPQSNFLSNFDFGSSGVSFIIRTPDFVADTDGSPWYDVLDGNSFGVIQAVDNTPRSTDNDGLGISIPAADILASGATIGDAITYSFLYAPGFNYDSNSRASDADSAIAVWIGNGSINSFAALPASPNTTVLSGAWAPSGTQNGFPTMATGTWQQATGNFTWTGGDVYFALQALTGATATVENIFIDRIVFGSFSPSPVAVDDAVSSAIGTQATVNPLSNDTDPDNSLDRTTVVLTGTGSPAGSTLSTDGKTLTVPNEGEWTVATNGEITFSPEAGFAEDPTPATYTVDDQAGNTSNEATVSIDYVEGPIATNDIDTTPVTGPVSINPIANDSGNVPLDPTTIVLTGTGAPSGSTLAPDGKSLTVPGEGIWSISVSGVATFAPEAAFSSAPTPAAYTVSDNNGAVSNEATIAFGATPTISAAADGVSTADASTGGTTPSVLNNDTLNGASISNPALVSLTPGAAPTPASGSIAMNADGTITVAPGTTQGTYTYSYEICDVANLTNCATAVATIVVGASDLLDEIEDDLVNVLEEDRAATVSQLSQQFSGYAANAGRRLRDRHSGVGTCLANINAILDRENILFDSDRAVIKAQSGRVLDEIAAILRECSGAAFEIAGHTDSDGSNAYNLELSQRRVDAVLRALATRQVNTTGFVARGYGESRPIASNATAVGKARNRRVEFRPLGGNVQIGSCEEGKHIRSLDASVNEAGASVDGRFLRDTHDCYNDVRQVYEGTLSYLDTDGGVAQTMLNLSYRRERFTNADNIRGYFLGAYLSRNDVTGMVDGDIEGMGINGGVYGADRFANGLFLDYYLGSAAGQHDFNLAFAPASGPLTASGEYTYLAAFAGAALTGELSFGNKVVAPRVGIDYVYSPESDVDVTALNGVPTSGSLELSSLAGGRFFAELGTSWSVNNGEARLDITPRVACYQSIEGLDGACGFGGAIELTSQGQDNDLIYSVELDIESGDGYSRGALSGNVTRALSVGTLRGTAKLAPEGSMTVGGSYELTF